MPEKIRLRVERRDRPDEEPYWQTFAVDYQPEMNVISCLQAVAADPVTVEGERTTPVVWDCNCLEEVCGACSMLINGAVRQACTALIDSLVQEGEEIELRPMTKFPVVRDLMVDRSKMFDALKRVRAWIPIDGTHDLGEGPKMGERERAENYLLSRCMTCGCCLEACPQVNERSHFIGPAALAQVVLFDSHPTGRTLRYERLGELMGPGGIADCGNAQNCVKVCPKEIPLTEAIAKAGRDATLFGIIRWLKK